MEKAIKIINNYLLQKENYFNKKNIVRVTELIYCLKKAVISKIYSHNELEIKYNPSSIIGIAMHDMMDKININKYERRLSTVIDDITITGEYDYYNENENIMYDYKFLNDVNNYKNEYELQINIYAYLFFLNYKIKPNKLIVKVIDINNFDDIEKDVAIYPPEFIFEYLQRRIALYKKGLDCISDIAKEQNNCFFCNDRIKYICENNNF